MVVTPRAGAQGRAAASRRCYTEPSMRTMSPSPAFSFAGLRGLGVLADLVWSIANRLPSLLVHL